MNYETQMRFNYENCDEMDYELSTSYPRHIKRIMEDIENAVSALSGIPGGEGISAAISTLPSLLETEKTRYANFSTAFNAYAEAANNSDQQVCAIIGFAFEEYYSNKSMEELKMMVRDYSTNFVLIDYTALTQISGLDNATIADLIYLNGLVNALEGMSQQDMEALLQKELVAMNKNSMTAKTITDILALLATTTIDKKLSNSLEDIIEKAVQTAIEKGTGLEATEAALAVAMGHINSLQNKLASANIDIAANPYIVPGGHHFAKRDSILRHLDGWQTKFNALDATKQANLATAAKVAGIGLFVLEVGAAGFESRVINGKDWEDSMEDMVVAAGGVGFGIGLGVIVSSAIEGTKAGAYGGPIGIAVGILVSVGYEIVVAPIVKEKASEFADSWHEFWW